MFWFDLNDGRLKQRNQNNSVWVSVYAIRNNQCVPTYNGADVSNIVAVQPNADGYVRCRNGVFVLESIDSPDIPMFGVGRSGIVPGVTSAQSGQPYKLLSNGTWSEPGFERLGYIKFAGAKEYALAVAPAKAYTLSVSCTMSGSNGLIMQIGSGGSPSQNGYMSRVSGNGNIASTDKGFIVYGGYDTARSMVMHCRLLNVASNTWTFDSVGGNVGTDNTQNPEVARGTVSINGRLNYIRFLSAGAPLGTLNNQNSMDSGEAAVFA